MNSAVFAIVAYAAFALYNRKNKDKSRATLALGSVLCVILSTSASFGLAMAFGLSFTPSAGIAVFLVLSIGLDDSFVIAGTVDEPFFEEKWYDLQLPALENDVGRVLESRESVEDCAARRIVHTLKKSGPSVTVTSITDAAALFAGSASLIPDIAIFNRFSGAAIMLDYLMQLTFFVALLTLDQRQRLRSKLKRMASSQAPLAKHRDKKIIEETASQQQQQQQQQPGHFFENDSDVFWKSRYPQMLLSRPGQAFVLGVSIVACGLGVVGCLRFRVDYEVGWTFVDGGRYGHAKKSWDFYRKHFSQSDTTSVGLYTKRADYSRGDVDRLVRAYEDQAFVIKDSLRGNWYEEHEKFRKRKKKNATALENNASTSEEWLASLREFVEEDERFVDKIAFDAETGAVAGARIDTRWKGADEQGIERTRQMLKSRRTVRQNAGDLGTVVVYNPGFIWYESHRVHATSMVFSMSVALGVVSFVLVLLLGDAFAALLVSLLIALACSFTFGSIYWYGDTVNSITAIFVPIAVGLSADAPAHICRAFLDSRLESRHLRAKEAIANLGAAVFRGQASTIAGLAITAFCATWVFRSFFRYLTTILLLSLWNGLALMPVLCSIIGPMPSHQRSNKY